MAPEKLENTHTSERLHKFIGRCGLCSRRKAEQLILEGRVTVNDQVVTELGTKINPQDQVRVDGVLLREPKLYYVVMNKPKGVLTTLDDPKKRPTVVKYLPDLGVTLKPVGRLDMDTEGLLLFTNDGNLALRMTHPRYSIEKEYLAKVKGQVSEQTAEKLRKGIVIEGKRTLPAKVTLIHYDKKSDSTQLRIILHEGRKRQIRNMCKAVSHPILSLKRVRIGFLTLKGMAPGMCHILTKVQVEKLKRMVNLT